MIKVKGYSSYFGGKSGNGTYQTIINHIPPHKSYFSLYLGNCGVTRHIRPATAGLLNDLDRNVSTAWAQSELPDNYVVSNMGALDILKGMQAGKYPHNPSESFIYLDPPYRLSSRKSAVKVYKHEMTDNDHLDLLSQ